MPTFAGRQAVARALPSAGRPTPVGRSGFSWPPHPIGRSSGALRRLIACRAIDGLPVALESAVGECSRWPTALGGGSAYGRGPAARAAAATAAAAAAAALAVADAAVLAPAAEVAAAPPATASATASAALAPSYPHPLPLHPPPPPGKAGKLTKSGLNKIKIDDLRAEVAALGGLGLGDDATKGALVGALLERFSGGGVGGGGATPAPAVPTVGLAATPAAAPAPFLLDEVEAAAASAVSAVSAVASEPDDGDDDLSQAAWDKEAGGHVEGSLDASAPGEMRWESAGPVPAPCHAQMHPSATRPPLRSPRAPHCPAPLPVGLRHSVVARRRPRSRGWRARGRPRRSGRPAPIESLRVGARSVNLGGN